MKTVVRCEYRKKSSRLSLFILLMTGLLVWTMSGMLAEANATRPDNFTKLAKDLGPAVVNIRTVKIVKGGGRAFRQSRPHPFGQKDPFNDFFNKFFGEDQQREHKQRSLGSGFIIDKEGFIVTNNHVIENADKIQVKLKDEREFEAEIVGRDPNTDLALIKIKADTDLPVARLGNSDDLEVGQWVVAIGSPFGLEQTVTAGIVSAKGRVIGSGPYDDFIQTDASINPGNSGGPLLNLSGEVVGINTAIIASATGIGFAVPVNMAKNVLAQLKENGEVTRGWLGVGIQSLSPEMSEYYGLKDRKGVLVVQAFKGDPAAEAGIKAQDVILEVNGKPVGDSRDLTGIVAAIPVGKTVTIKVLRQGRTKTFKVKIAKREDDKIMAKKAEKQKGDELGIEVVGISSEMAKNFGIKENDGVLVAAVEPKGKAAEAGLQRGDVIKEINHQPVDSVAAYQEAVGAVKTGKPVNMFILRARAGFMVIRMTK
jgi:serine protease Do